MYHRFLDTVDFVDTIAWRIILMFSSVVQNSSERKINAVVLAAFTVVTGAAQLSYSELFDYM